jgi:hypothetical protein
MIPFHSQGKGGRNENRPKIFSHFYFSSNLYRLRESSAIQQDYGQIALAGFQ